MAKTKRMILGVLLMLGMVLGMSVMANADTAPKLLTKGTILTAGDTIGPLSEKIFWVTIDNSTGQVVGAIPLEANSEWLIVRESYTMNGTTYQGYEDPNGKNYGLKRLDGNGIYFFHELAMTDTSDGLIVKDVEIFSGIKNVTIAVHEPEHTHNYAESWSSDNAKHWHACTSATGPCDAPKKDEAVHTYGTSGNARYTCSVCGYVNEAKKADAEAADKTTTGTTVATKTAEEPEEKVTIKTAPKLMKATAKKNKVTVVWKKIKKNKKGKALLKQIKSIEVQCSTDPAFPKETTVTKPVGKKKTKAVLKLQRKKTYYVRVRYIGSNGVSKWSRVKKVKTK